jgi:hypothetical protein
MAASGLTLLSPAEKSFIEDGVAQNFRGDGRQCGKPPSSSLVTCDVSTLSSPTPPHSLTRTHTLPLPPSVWTRVVRAERYALCCVACDPLPSSYHGHLCPHMQHGGWTVGWSMVIHSLLLSRWCCSLDPAQPRFVLIARAPSLSCPALALLVGPRTSVRSHSL